MPIRPTKGTRQTNLELPTDVIDRAKTFAKARGETLSEVVVAALLRHMANPPPLPEQFPLPPVPAPEPIAPKPAKGVTKKPKGKK
jgi:hypothetical protein